MLHISLSKNLPVCLCEEDMLKIVETFSLKEIKLAVFSMEHNKALGPMGSLLIFFQNFLSHICHELLSLFNEFHAGRLDIRRFKYGIITLLPKGQGADEMQMIRPICLINVIFKIFTKVINNRVMPLADKLVSSVQSAFIQVHFIFDSMESIFS